MARSAFVIVCLACLCSQPAAAYLDPASGSLLLQALLAGLLALVVALKHYWKRLWSWLHRGRAKEDEKAPPGPPASEA